MTHHNDTQAWEDRFWKKRVDGCATVEELFAGGDMWSVSFAKRVLTPLIQSELQRAREEAIEECQIKQEEREDMFWLALSKLSPDKPYAIDCRYHNAMPLVDGVCPRCPSVRYAGLTDLKNKK